MIEKRLDDTVFNDCIVELMGNRMQRAVLDFLFENYRFNRVTINRFDKILAKHNVRKSEKYGVGWEMVE